MKICVITLHATRNYGSALQSLATQYTFEKAGCDVIFVNFIRKDSLDHNLPNTMTENNKGAVKFAKKMILRPTVARWRKVFDSFLSENINLTPQVYSSEEDFQKYGIPEADIYCTGSDQVWNSGWNKGILRPFYLSFAPDDKRKIAYSASFGKPILDEWEIPETRELLRRYDAISVREKSAVDILERQLGISGTEHVLDPTLAVPREFWKKRILDRRIKEKYVLVYQLNSNPEFEQYQVKFAKKHGLQLVRFCYRYDQLSKPGKHILIPDVLEFPSMIYHAEYVLTDSFHATAFSINLNKKFVSLYPSQYGGRIQSILELTGLQSRHLSGFNDFYLNDEGIDYSRVNQILDIQRQSTENFVKRAIGL